MARTCRTPVTRVVGTEVHAYVGVNAYRRGRAAAKIWRHGWQLSGRRTALIFARYWSGSQPLGLRCSPPALAYLLDSMHSMLTGYRNQQYSSIVW